MSANALQDFLYQEMLSEWCRLGCGIWGGRLFGHRVRRQIDTAFLAVRRLQHEFDTAADGTHHGREEDVIARSIMAAVFCVMPARQKILPQFKKTLQSIYRYLLRPLM